MPFKSEAQRKKCWMLHDQAIAEGKVPEWDCEEWEEETKRLGIVLTGGKKRSRKGSRKGSRKLSRKVSRKGSKKSSNKSSKKKSIKRSRRSSRK